MVESVIEPVIESKVESKIEPKVESKVETEKEGKWLPLMEYAMKKGVSLSTLRRYIKAKKIIYKVDNGRYLLKDEDNELISTQLQTTVCKLERDLQRAHEEIAELKTLIALYEEKIPPHRINN